MELKNNFVMFDVQRMLVLVLRDLNTNKETQLHIFNLTKIEVSY